jgi:hypothetical protein
MKPYRVFDRIKAQELKTVLRWIKKYSKFGAYGDVEELNRFEWKVTLYCPPLYTDILGNSAIKPKV